MKLYYFQSEGGNFGDDLNLWLWPKLLDQPFGGYCHHSVEDQPTNEREEALFLGIGTLLNTTVPEDPVKFVFGTGAGYGPPPVVNERWRFFCVRGPLTAKRLGLPPELAATDPAVLVRLFDLPPPAEHVRFSYMPHIRSTEVDLWKEVCQELGIRYIHPGKGVENILSDILGSEAVITEAMHGAIVSDALRIPWIPVCSYDYISRFKWQDWCQSLRIPYHPTVLPSLWSWPRQAGMLKRFEATLRVRRVAARLARVMKNPPLVLSSDEALDLETSHLQERLELLRGSLPKPAAR